MESNLDSNTNRHDPRAIALEAWCRQQLTQLGRPWPAEEHLRSVSGDASFRRYFRAVTPTGSFVAVDAPPPQEDSAPFLRAAEVLRGCGVRVPEVYRVDQEAGFLLLEDFGDTLYLERLEPENVEHYYQQAFQSLTRIIRCPDGLHARFPPYDAPLLMREMELFRDWFLPRYLELHWSADRLAILQRQFERLRDSALEQPRVLVHRDFHSRNLMVVDEGEPGVIDFQDAVVGPITYDLVSLLRDCYIAWPQSRVESWVVGMAARLRDEGMLPGVSDAQFLRWFDWMGVQRHLKAIGIFARLYFRDGKRGYLPDIPRTIRYVVDVCRRYPELLDLSKLLADEIVPALQQRAPDAKRWLQVEPLLGKQR